MARVGLRYRGFVLPMPSAAGIDRNLLRDVGTAGTMFWRDNAMGMAGMVAFFGFLSLVPMLILLLAVVGGVFGGVMSAHDLQRMFHGAVPGLTQKQFLSSYWEPIRHSKVATTVLGAISLLVGMTGLHDSLDFAVNRLWHVRASRRFWVAKARGLGVMVWAILFAVLSFALAWAWSVLLFIAQAPSGLSTLATALVPTFILDVAVFTALYRLTPMLRVRLRAALTAGVFGALLWEASKLVFGWWVLNAGTYDRVYGPLTASVIVMLWLWLSAMIFLFGAAFSAAIQFRLADLKPAPESWWYDT